MLNTSYLLKGKPFVLWFSSPFGIERGVFSHFIFQWKQCDYCLLKTVSDYEVINTCESKPVNWKRRIWRLRLLHFDYYGLWCLSVCMHFSRFVSVAKTKHIDQEQLRGVGSRAYSVFNSRSPCIFGEKFRQELKQWVTLHPQLRTERNKCICTAFLPATSVGSSLVWLCPVLHSSGPLA